MRIYKGLSAYLKERLTFHFSSRPSEGGTLALSKPETDSPQKGARSGGPKITRREFTFGAVSAVVGFLAGGAFGTSLSRTLPESGDIGELYHQWSKPSYLGPLRRIWHWGIRPSQYRVYPGSLKIELPPALSFRGLSLEEAIERRRSKRTFSGQPMSPLELSRLLHYASGITERRFLFRAAPSAGALYPIELYPVINDIEGLDRGIYHYSGPDHSLELVRQGDFRREMVQHGLGQGMLGEANVVFIMSAIFQRTRWRYRERSYRYVLLEAGHIAENIYLSATSSGLGSCAIGAFYDDDFNRMLGIDGKEEAIIYIMVVGKI